MRSVNNDAVSNPLKIAVISNPTVATFRVSLIEALNIIASSKIHAKVLSPRLGLIQSTPPSVDIGCEKKFF